MDFFFHLHLLLLLLSWILVVLMAALSVWASLAVPQRQRDEARELAAARCLVLAGLASSRELLDKRI